MKQLLLLLGAFLTLTSSWGSEEEGLSFLPSGSPSSSPASPTSSSTPTDEPSFDDVNDNLPTARFPNFVAVEQWAKAGYPSINVTINGRLYQWQKYSPFIGRRNLLNPPDYYNISAGWTEEQLNRALVVIEDVKIWNPASEIGETDVLRLKGAQATLSLQHPDKRDVKCSIISLQILFGGTFDRR